MTHEITRRSILAGISATGLWPSTLARAQKNKTIRFGLTPVFLTNDIDLLEKLESYLSAATGYNIELVRRRTYQEVTSLLISGEIDAAWICGYPFVKNRSRLNLVAVPVWNGKPLYQSYVIVSKNRKENEFVSLRGDIHAFSDPDSNSGFLVTRALLASMNENPETFFAKTFYTYGHRNVIRAVASGLAGSGSVDGYIWEIMRQREPGLINQTRVIRKSEWLGFPPVACTRQAAGQNSIVSLINAFTHMRSRPEGRAVLDLLGLDGFGTYPPSLFDGIAAKVALVGSA